MNRRAFLKLTGIAALAPSLPAAASQPESCPTRLVLSGDGNGHTYEYCAWYDGKLVSVVAAADAQRRSAGCRTWIRVKLSDPSISRTQSEAS